MNRLRTWLHWKIQELADLLYEKRMIRAGHAAVIIAGKIFPKHCKADPAQWNGYVNNQHERKSE